MAGCFFQTSPWPLREGRQSWTPQLCLFWATCRSPPQGISGQPARSNQVPQIAHTDRTSGPKICRVLIARYVAYRRQILRLLLEQLSQPQYFQYAVGKVRSE